MNLVLKRNVFTDTSTIGELFIDGKFECFILEDVDRKLTSEMSLEEIKAIKVYGKTCIPYGSYRVHITFSNRFNKLLPIVEGVKGFEGIRIHTGNSAEDSSGCLIVGTAKADNLVIHSKDAFKNLLPKLESCTEEIKLLIIK